MDIEQARKVVAAVLNDLTDRRGLRQEWENIDDDIQAEIRETWAAIVVEYSEGAGSKQ